MIVSHYYSCLNWHPDNTDLLQGGGFVMTISEDPSVLMDPYYYEAEVLFLPIRPAYTPEFFKRFSKLKFVVSNTTSERHLIHKPDHVRAITLKGDHFLQDITSTPEHALGLIMALHRRIPAASYEVATTCTWDRYRWPAPTMLSRMHLGILGAGRVGRMLSHMANPIFKKVSMFEPKGRSGVLLDNDLATWLSEIDVLSIHLALVPETENFMSDERLAFLRPHALVVNTAQGAVVDNEALLNMLENEGLRGVALDVFPDAPSMEQVFVKACAYAQSHDNLILTPHIAGSTEDAWCMTEARVIEKLLWEYQV